MKLSMDKFDNTKPNVILISDFTETIFLQKSFGVYKVARELRLAGYEVAVIHHAHIFSYDEIKYILKNLISNKTLFVGFNNMFYRAINQVDANKIYEGGVVWGDRELGSMLPHGLNLNKDLKAYIRSLNPTTKVVLGGPTASDVSSNKDFDYVVVGYADVSAVNLADHLSKGVVLEKSYKSINGPTIVNDATAKTFDFVNSLMEYKSYDCILPQETLFLEVGRGCIFNCAFCSYPLNGKKKNDYVKHEDKLYAEIIDNYERFGVTRYQMVDDTFNDDIGKIQMFHNLSKRLPFKLEYWAYTRLDLLAAHPETIDLLFDSGLRGCYFGIESLNKQTGSAIGKGLGREKLISTLRYIKSRWGDDVMLHGSFITGLPYESKESIYETCHFLTSDNNPLDSWHLRGFCLDDSSVNTDGFFSRIAKDPTSFGYKNLRKVQNSNYLYWENDATNSDEAEQIASHYRAYGEQIGKRKVDGQTSFMLSGLGLDLDFSKNKKLTDIDWHWVDLRKQQRGREYKELFYKEFNIVPFS